MRFSDRFQAGLIDHERKYAVDPVIVLPHYALTYAERTSLDEFATAFPIVNVYPPSLPLTKAVWDFDAFVTGCWEKTMPWSEQSSRPWIKYIVENGELMPLPPELYQLELLQTQALATRDTTRLIHPDVALKFEASSKEKRKGSRSRYFSPDARKFYLLLEEVASLAEGIDNKISEYFRSAIGTMATHALVRPRCDDFLPSNIFFEGIIDGHNLLKSLLVERDQLDTARRLDEIGMWIGSHVGYGDY